MQGVRPSFPRCFHRLTVGAAGLLLLLPSCTRPEDPGAGEARVVWRLPGEPDSLDPARASGSRSQSIIRRTHQGLVSPDPATGMPVPGLAEGWEVDPDGLRYVFHLRPELTFHDGREVGADDAVYSLARHFDPGVGSSLLPFLRDIVGAGAPRGEGARIEVDGIRSLGPRTLEIRLQRPFAPLLGVLSMPQASVVPAGSLAPATGSGLPGTGPFLLAGWELGRHIRLDSFDGYHAGRPFLDGVTFRFVIDEGTALAAYEAGELDILDGLPAGRRAAVMAARPGEYHKIAAGGLVALVIHHGGSPLGKDVRLRRALAHAVDREYICRVLNEGKDLPANQLLPPGFAGRDPELDGYPYDLAAAARLLAEAGHPGGEGLAPLRGVYHLSDPAGARLLERLQADLREIGVTLQLEPLEYAVFAERVGRGDGAMDGFDLFRVVWAADYQDPDALFTPLVHGASIGGGGGNVSYRDAELDALLDRGRSTVDPLERERIYRQASRRVHDQVALIPIYWLGDELLVRPGIEGVRLGPLGETTVPLEEVRLRGGG